VTAVVVAVTETLAVTVAVELLVAVALITAATAAAGAVYVVLAPLAVCAGLKVPHVPVGVHVQSTPAFAVSFVTVAMNTLGRFTGMDEGRRGVKEIATVLFAAVIVTVATAVAVWVLVELAVIVTLAAAFGAV
jgi:hypothetical protein